MADGVYGMAPSINDVWSYDAWCTEALRCLFWNKVCPYELPYLTTMAIQRQLLATMKWQSRQRHQLVGLKKIIVADDSSVTYVFYTVILSFACFLESIERETGTRIFHRNTLDFARASLVLDRFVAISLSRGLHVQNSNAFLWNLLIDPFPWCFALVLAAILSAMTAAEKVYVNGSFALKSVLFSPLLMECIINYARTQ